MSWISKRKKAPQRPVLHVQFFVCAECFAHVPARAQVIASILLGSLGTLVFTMIYGIHCYFFRFADLMLLSFSQDNIRRQKNRAHLRSFESLSVYKRHRVRDLCRFEFKPFLVQDIFDIIICGLSINTMKAVKAFSISFFGTLDKFFFRVNPHMHEIFWQFYFMKWGPRGLTKGNTQLARQNDFSFT